MKSKMTIYDLLKEEDGSEGKKKKEKVKPEKKNPKEYKDFIIEFDVGRTNRLIDSSKARAVSEPEALLQDLGIEKDSSGSTSVEVVGNLVMQAIDGDSVFSQVFIGGEFLSGKNIFLIETLPGIRHPDKYVGAVVAALVNAGWFPEDSIEYRYRKDEGGDKKTSIDTNMRDIVRTSDGQVLIRDLKSDSSKKGDE